MFTVPVRHPRRSRLVAAAITAGVVGALCTASSGFAAAQACEPTEIPSPSNTGSFLSDENVSVYVGGDLLVDRAAAEIEGLVVVNGNVSVAMHNHRVLNIGTVGVGSGVVPDPGETMLAIGGDLSIIDGNRVLVGSPVRDHAGGGQVLIGGTFVPSEAQTRLDANGGNVLTGLGTAATADWDALSDDIAQASRKFAGLASTGDAIREGARLTFAGTGAESEVFEIAGDDLAATEYDFTGIADGARVVINVTGEQVRWAPNVITENSKFAGTDRIDNPSPGVDGFGKVAARTIWNFPDAVNVKVLGSSQVLGSLLIPTVNTDKSEYELEFTASTNGRLLVNGSVRMHGVGNEHHNYPFIDENFGCDPEPEVTPEPTPEPTPDPTPEPTSDPTSEPTPEPTDAPEVTPEPTPEPSGTPEVTPEPTETPEAEVTPEPTPVPTATPDAPSEQPDGDGGLAVTGAIVPVSMIMVGVFAAGAGVLLMMLRRSATS
ncbi:choice-of-anchor A family protein [Microbacterium sp. YY-01]|uniref:choice-of-anchor A family protein n=1 Tax=Microbacterium sp. YY-01 TaxID=3421634 RepID=UPI003D169821